MGTTKNSNNGGHDLFDLTPLLSADISADLSELCDNLCNAAVLRCNSLPGSDLAILADAAFGELFSELLRRGVYIQSGELRKLFMGVFIPELLQRGLKQGLINSYLVRGKPYPQVEAVRLTAGRACLVQSQLDGGGETINAVRIGWESVPAMIKVCNSVITPKINSQPAFTLPAWIDERSHVALAIPAHNFEEAVAPGMMIGVRMRGKTATDCSGTILPAATARLLAEFLRHQLNRFTGPAN